jgi:hypothetical protein
MNRIIFGLLAGLIFGVISVLILLPLKFDDKRKKTDACIAAFFNRFMIGFIVPNLDLGLPPAVTGAVLGLGLSLPSAVYRRDYGGALGLGIVGGALIAVLCKIILSLP